MIEIFINGSKRRVPESTTVEELIESIGLPKKGIALAINNEVIPKSRWNERSLSPQDRVELLTIAQGG